MHKLIDGATKNLVDFIVQPVLRLGLGLAVEFVTVLWILRIVMACPFECLFIFKSHVFVGAAVTKNRDNPLRRPILLLSNLCNQSLERVPFINENHFN